MVAKDSYPYIKVLLTENSDKYVLILILKVLLTENSDKYVLLST